MALRADDGEARAAVMEKIRTFNARWPQVAISPSVLRASLRQRANDSARAEIGIVLDRRLAAQIRQEVGAVAE
jgi:hypothetical protein